MSERSTVSVRIDPKLWKEARKKAIDMDMTISEFVERSIKEKINKK
ncbi:MAG: hypothetical protein ABIH55_01640 [Nanoarchaeota archaeon]